MTTDAETIEPLDTEAPEDNAVALNRLLEKIEEVSNSVQRDKGTRFETLVKDWLSKDKTYCNLFTKIQTFKEWAKEHEDLAESARDNGIDLVATNKNDDFFTAIQCKFYGSDQVVPKSGVDSFIANSERAHFTQRFLIATNSRWTDNLRNQLLHLTPPHHAYNA